MGPKVDIAKRHGRNRALSGRFGGPHIMFQDVGASQPIAQLLTIEIEATLDAEERRSGSLIVAENSSLDAIWMVNIKVGEK